MSHTPKAIGIFAICMYLSGALLFSACEPAFEQLDTSGNASLSFSGDTVYFDTIFSQLKTQTLRLRVYNPSPNAVIISAISVLGGEDSPFQVIVNGIQSQRVEDLRILGNDSLYVLVRTEPEAADTGVFLIEDFLRFETDGNMQQVVLRAFGQDAYYYDDDILCDQVWGADKPHVVIGDVLVDTLCSLTVLEGAKLYFNASSDLFVRGSLIISGTPQNPVSLQQIRQDASYQDLPGQWDGITFLAGSRDNLIDHAIIRNAMTGIYLGTPDQDTIPDLILTHTRIENMAMVGVQCFSADLEMSNCLINNCIDHTFSALIGGHYTLVNNTLANYSFDFSRELPQAVFGNNLPGSEPYLTADLSLTLVNNIIWGDFEEELFFLNDQDVGFEIIASHNLLRTELIPVFDTNGHILNQNPLFDAPSAYRYHLDSLSPAKNTGINIPSLQDDLLGNPRDSRPDIGAFEFISN